MIHSQGNVLVMSVHIVFMSDKTLILLIISLVQVTLNLQLKTPHRTQAKCQTQAKCCIRVSLVQVHQPTHHLIMVSHTYL